jgi:hypothetical protein
VKNLFELKNARRVLVEENVFENNWADAQAGFALPWKSVNQDGSCSWCQTSDVTFRWNIVRNSAAGLSLASNPEVYSAVPAARFLVENNLFENVGNFLGTDNGRMIFLGGGLKDVTINNNTLIHNTFNGSGQFIIMDTPNGGTNLVVRNNVATWGGPWGAVMGTAPQGTQALAAFATAYAFEGNTVIGLPSSLVSMYPTGNYWPGSTSSVGFNSDYSLSASSPYKGKAVGGGDPGANIATLKSKTSGVIVP